MRACRLVCLLLGLGLLAGCEPAAESAPEPEPDTAAAPAPLTVFAAASLNEVMQRLSDASVAAGGPALIINAAGTQALVAQLRSGVAADLFCSANRKYGDQMADEGLTGPAITLAQNHLALAATTLNEKVSTFADVTKEGIKIVRCDTAVPAGSYTDQALDALAAAGDGATAEAITARVVSLEAQVTGVVAKLKTGAADAGFCYRTDRVAAGLREIELPEPMRLSTACTIAVVAKSSVAEQAQAFIDWLAAPEAKAIFEAAGFEVPEPAAP